METMKRSFSDALMDIDIDINSAEYTTPFYHQPKKHQKGLESAEDAEQPVGRQYTQKRRHLNLEDDDDWEVNPIVVVTYDLVNQQSDPRKKRVCLEIEKDFDRLSLSSKDSLETYDLVHVPKPKLDKIGGLVGFVDLQNHSNWPVFLRVEDVTENDFNLNGNRQLICWKGKEKDLHDSYSVLEVDDFDPEALCSDRSSLDIEVMSS